MFLVYLKSLIGVNKRVCQTLCDAPFFRQISIISTFLKGRWFHSNDCCGVFVPRTQKKPNIKVLSDAQCIIIAIRVPDYSGCVWLRLSGQRSSGGSLVIALFNKGFALTKSGKKRRSFHSFLTRPVRFGCSEHVQKKFAARRLWQKKKLTHLNYS